MIASLCSTGLSAAFAQVTDSQPEALRRVMTSEVIEHDFAGVVLVSKRGRVLLHEAYGLANVEHRVPHRVETKFKIYSTTKMLTAVAVLRLVEQGRLDLETPIARYLPELPASWRQVTLHQLLTHTSGIADFSNEWIRAWQGSNLETLVRVAPKLVNAALETAPGTTFKYNNAGYELVGCVVERVTQQSYGAALRTIVFEPAGMTASTTEQPQAIRHEQYLGPAPIQDLATGYNGGPRQPEVAFSEMYKLAAAGSVVSTSGDLYRFSNGLFGGELVAHALLAKMMTGTAAAPYGYGLVIRDKLGRKYLRHDGGNNGFLSSVEHYPDDGLTIIVLSNRGYVRLDALRTALAESVLAAVPVNGVPPAR